MVAAFSYIEFKKIGSSDMRFDVVSVDLSSGDARIIRNAFEVNVQPTDRGILRPSHLSYRSEMML